MIDVGRFMQDGVGVKDKQYEVSILSGSGTFVANGKIVIAVSVSTFLARDDYTLGAMMYLFPSTSTDEQTAWSTSGAKVNFAYVDAKTITYTAIYHTYPNKIIIVSEKE